MFRRALREPVLGAFSGAADDQPAAHLASGNAASWCRMPERRPFRMDRARRSIVDTICPARTLVQNERTSRQSKHEGEKLCVPL